MRCHTRNNHGFAHCCSSTLIRDAIAKGGPCASFCNQWKGIGPVQWSSSPSVCCWTLWGVKTYFMALPLAKEIMQVFIPGKVFHPLLSALTSEYLLLGQEHMQEENFQTPWQWQTLLHCESWAQKLCFLGLGLEEPEYIFFVTNFHSALETREDQSSRGWEQG